MADATKPSDAAGSSAGVDAAGSGDVNWAAAAAARVSGRAANKANAASARPSALGRKATRRRRYKPACVSSGALTVLTGIVHCAVGLCIPQFRAVLTGMWNRGRRTGAAFEFTGEHDLMLSLALVMFEFSGAGWCALGLLISQYEQRSGTAAPRVLGVAMALSSLLFAALVPVSGFGVWALVGVVVAVRGSWSTGVADGLPPPDASATRWKAPAVRSGSLVIALCCVHTMTGVALPALQKASLRVARRMHTALPWDVDDDVLAPEIAAVMFQLVAVVWVQAGWLATRMEDVCREPATASVGAVLTFSAGVCAWLTPASGFWFALPIGVLVVWRARGGSSDEAASKKER